jgi:hypothetical protein
MEQGGNMIPALRDAAPAVEGVKGITFALDITNTEDVKMDVSMACKNADDAGKLKNGVQASVEALRALLGVAQLAPQRPGQPRMPATLMDDLNSITLTAKDTTATASMKISNQTIQDVTALGMAQRGNFPFGGGFMPPQNFPKGGGGPVGQPKGGGAKISNMTVQNFAAGQTKESVHNFPQGAKLQIHIHSASPQGAVLDVAVLRGAAGEKVVFTSNKGGAVRIVDFNIPAADTYRVRMRNLGPGAIPNCHVAIFEN